MNPPTRSQSDILGYGRQCIDEDDIAAVAEVLRGETLTQGPAVEHFEQGLARATGADHVVAVSSGTAALHLAYLTLGVEPGMSVWVPANTFLATAAAAAHCGADITVLDVDRSGNLDLRMLKQRLEREGPPHVVVPVHFAGLPVDMDRLVALKRRFGFQMIEDAAHALGSRYKIDGRWWSPGAHPEVEAACLSFHPVKSITSGEGGAVLVNDSSMAARLRRLRSHGIARDYADLVPFAPMIELGFNYRLSDIHAALGASQLEKLPRFVVRRQEIAARYTAQLEGYELPSADGPDREHAWHLYVVKVDPAEREPLAAWLRERGIGTQLHYAPVTWHPWFRCRLESQVPRAEDHARRALSIPMHPGLTDEEVDRVVEELNAWRRR